jgi:hypothetical protein
VTYKSLGSYADCGIILTTIIIKQNETTRMFLRYSRKHSFGCEIEVWSMKFRFVFWDVLPCKIIVDQHFRGTCCLHQGALVMEAARTSETSVDNSFTRQYIPEYKSGNPFGCLCVMIRVRIIYRKQTAPRKRGIGRSILFRAEDVTLSEFPPPCTCSSLEASKSQHFSHFEISSRHKDSLSRPLYGQNNHV